jgi:hypothetical protein
MSEDGIREKLSLQHCNPLAVDVDARAFELFAVGVGNSFDRLAICKRKVVPRAAAVLGGGRLLDVDRHVREEIDRGVDVERAGELHVHLAAIAHRERERKIFSVLPEIVTVDENDAASTVEMHGLHLRDVDMKRCEIIGDEVALFVSPVRGGQPRFETRGQLGGAEDGNRDSIDVDRGLGGPALAVRRSFLRYGVGRPRNRGGGPTDGRDGHGGRNFAGLTGGRENCSRTEKCADRENAP